MLRFRDILTFPSFYSKRNTSIKQTPIDISKVNKEEEYIEVIGISNKYSPKIRILGDFNLNSNVLIFCDCESFKFEFSNPVFQNNSLLDIEKFSSDLNKRPRKKNTYMVASGCKHIISLANLFTKRKNRYI